MSTLWMSCGGDHNCVHACVLLRIFKDFQSLFGRFCEDLAQAASIPDPHVLRCQRGLNERQADGAAAGRRWAVR